MFGRLTLTKLYRRMSLGKGSSRSEVLLFLGIAEEGRFGQGEEDNLLASHGADIVVETQHYNASDLLDHDDQGRPCQLDQLRTDRLSRSLPLLSWQCLDQLLFSSSQNAPEADNEEITDQVGVNFLGASAHEFLFKATDAFANGGLDFSQCLHHAHGP